MSGELNLEALLRGMSATLVEGVFVFATLPKSEVPTRLNPLMIFHEAEGVTLILKRDQAEEAKIPNEFPCRMITLNIHSALEAVGFIAYIASKLAEAGMGVNPVSGFYHDHLFVPEGREFEALAILQAISDG
jgi:hypothetical protein